MKSIIVSGLLSVSFLVSTAQAQVCYVAKDPSNVAITAKNSKGASVSEKALVVTAVLESVNEAQQAYNLTLVARSKNLAYWTVALNGESENPNDFGVECDGGTVQIKKSADNLILSSAVLSGEVKGLQDGCSNAKVKFKKLKLQPVACE